MIRSHKRRPSSLPIGKMHLNVPSPGPDDGGSAEFRVPPSQAQPKHVFTTCHYCGHDPGVIPADAVCPKCGGHSWERNAISVRLLPGSTGR